MAFKMNGSPAKTGGISGTAGHSSALKMRAEENATSALKQKTDYEAMQAKSAKNDPRYGKMSAADYKTEVLRQSASKKAGKGYDAMGAYDSKGNKTSDTGSAESSKRSVKTKGRKTTTTFSDKEGVTVTQKKKNLLNKGTTTKKASVMADGTTKKSKFKKDADGDDRMKKTTTKATGSDGSTYVKKSKSKYDKDGVRKKAKTVIKTDKDGDGKVDRKYKLKTNDKKGTEKTVVKEGGRRTVRKTDKEGNTTTKSRRTLKGFFTGKGKEKKNARMPAPTKKYDK